MTKLKDVSCGYFAVNKKAMEAFVTDSNRGLIPKGYGFDVGLRASMIRHGLRIKEVPVSVNYRKSSYKGLRHQIKMFFAVEWAIIWLGLRHIREAKK